MPDDDLRERIARETPAWRIGPSADHFTPLVAAIEEYARVALLSRPSGCPDHGR